jgi:hypothetical protein
MNQSNQFLKTKQTCQMNQTQQEELEVLKSMYLNDFQDMTQETPHFKIHIEGKSKNS